MPPNYRNTIVDRGALSHHLYFIHKISTARVMNRVKIVEMHRFSIYFLAVIGHKKVLLGQARSRVVVSPGF